MIREQYFFIVDVRAPWRKITLVMCEVIEGPKMLWAFNGKKRCLIGSSAFQTIDGATRKRMTLLQNTANGAVARTAPYAYQAAINELRKYKSGAKDIAVPCPPYYARTNY